MTRVIILALVFVLAGVTSGLVVSVNSLRSRLGAEQGPGESRRTAIVSAAERVGPATVSISAVKSHLVRNSPFPDDGLFERFFRGYYPDRVYRGRYDVGSGFIIDSDGYILTNDHVVRGGSEVKVVLRDGREFDGTVVGADQRYDLAVVKIDGNDLPTAPLGDSDGVLIGEWVVAIGNPFGYILNDAEPTVTAGVVSALHRDIQPSGTSAVYKDMIQTDAAINRGNSGGPLVNSSGEVIGISTFTLSSEDGAYFGMSFAIPINTARVLVDELVRYGRVRDIWIGMGLVNVTPLVARALDLAGADGTLVAAVEPESPADRAGLRPGDVIIAVNGVAVSNAAEVRRATFAAKVGDAITVTAIRRGRTRELNIKLEEVPG
jgi:serine protease Do